MKWLYVLVHDLMVSWRWYRLCEIHEKREEVLGELMQCRYGSLAAERLEPLHNRLQARQDRMALKLGIFPFAANLRLEKLSDGSFPPPPDWLYSC